MHTLRRTATAVLVAVALLLVAGLGVFRQLRADARGPMASTSALDAPIVPTASLDQAIADLQAHLAAIPDDHHRGPVRTENEAAVAQDRRARDHGQPKFPGLIEALGQSRARTADEDGVRGEC